MKKTIALLSIILLSACGPSREEVERMEKARFDSIQALKKLGIVEPNTDQGNGMKIEGILVNGCTYLHDPNCTNHHE